MNIYFLLFIDIYIYIIFNNFFASQFKHLATSDSVMDYAGMLL